jgi:hypothetical protein
MHLFQKGHFPFDLIFGGALLVTREAEFPAAHDPVLTFDQRSIAPQL